MLFSSEVFEKIKKYFYREYMNDQNESVMFGDILIDAKQKEFMGELEYFMQDRASLENLDIESKIKFLKQKIKNEK